MYAIGVIEQSLSMLSVRGNNDKDVAEYYVNHLMFPLIRRRHDGAYFTVLSSKKPHHDDCVMTGCDADETVSGNLSNNRLDSPGGLYFYATSFWTSKLFRTSRF